MDDASTITHSRRLDFGRPPATDLPTHDADRDGATKASPQEKAATRVVRTVITRILIVDKYELMVCIGKNYEVIDVRTKEVGLMRDERMSHFSFFAFFDDKGL